MTATLPPPEPYGVLGVPVWSADQLRAYAAAAVLTERERCIDICGQHASIEGIAQRIAASIRASMTDRTHAEGCHAWGPAHYECALAELRRLHAENESLRAKEFKPKPLFASGEQGVVLSATEPVAWGWRSSDGVIRDCIGPDEHDRNEGDYTVPLYAAPAAPLEPSDLHDQTMVEARRIAREYAWPHSNVDDGNLYWALHVCLRRIDAMKEQP